jgi:ankyrin repeat protein
LKLKDKALHLLLTRRDGDVNARTDRDCWTALVVASKNGSKDLLKSLLKRNGIEVDKTAIDWANKQGHVDIAKMLQGFIVAQKA